MRRRQPISRRLPGNGLTGTLERQLHWQAAALPIYQRTYDSVRQQERHPLSSLASEGKTPLCFTKDGQSGWYDCRGRCHQGRQPAGGQENCRTWVSVWSMLTGDNERTARAIGAQAGVDEVIAGVLPDGKESVIRSLKEQGKVAMVGDGINDAPALTSADIGIAIGAGTDVAIDAADVVLMKSRLSDVPAAIRLSRATLTKYS